MLATGTHHGGVHGASRRPSGIRDSLAPKTCRRRPDTPLASLMTTQTRRSRAIPTLRPRPSGELLVQIYGLTPAEARVAVAVAMGDRIGGVAETFGVSTNTVKTLLQRTFAKTDTRRQTKLAALVTRVGRFMPSRR